MNVQRSLEQRPIPRQRQRRRPKHRGFDRSHDRVVAVAAHDARADDVAARQLRDLHGAVDAGPRARRSVPVTLDVARDHRDVLGELAGAHRREPRGLGLGRALQLRLELRLPLPLGFLARAALRFLAGLALGLLTRLALRLFASLSLRLLAGFALGLLASPAFGLLARLPLGLLARAALRFLSCPALLLGATRFLLPPQLFLTRAFLRFALPTSFLLAGTARRLLARPLLLDTLLLGPREQRLVDDDGLDRERGGLRRWLEVDVHRERAEYRPVQHDRPGDGGVTLAFRRGHAMNPLSALLGVDWIGDESDLLRAGLLQQHHAGHDAAVLDGTIGLDQHRRLGVTPDRGRRPLDHGRLVDRRFDVLADVEIKAPFAIDAEHDRLVVLHHLRIERLGARLRKVDVDSL